MLSLSLTHIYMRYIFINKRYVYYIMANLIYIYIIKGHFEQFNSQFFYVFTLYSTISMSYLLSLDTIDLITNLKVDRILLKANKTLRLKNISMFVLPVIYTFTCLLISNLYLVTSTKPFVPKQVFTIVSINLIVVYLILITEKLSSHSNILKVVIRNLILMIILMSILVNNLT